VGHIRDPEREAKNKGLETDLSYLCSYSRSSVYQDLRMYRL
jgi:hypothetical protein